MTVKTRFAPSPTGSLHIGGARTAIFNWLYARRNNGKFVLRIEDTDRSRFTKESIDEIIGAMRWLGLDWDEGPVRQSSRLRVYQELARELLESGKAYKCYVTPEELEERRKAYLERGEVLRYKREWANENAHPDNSYSIRLKTPDDGIIEVKDILRGVVRFNADEIDDFVILRRDGFPTYNFAVVVDDADMKITHVIRGDDHLINTPRQALLFDALSYDVPKVAHVSMILGSDGKRLSKRHGATSVLAYRDAGYLSEALVNYLVRLGWSHGDQEIFSKEELIDKFTLDSLGRSPAVSNPEKLNWLNAYYIKKKPAKQLAELILPIMQEKGCPAQVDNKLAMIIEQLRERSKTLNDFVAQSSYFYADDIEYEQKAKDKFLKEENIPLFNTLIVKLTSIQKFNHSSIHKALEEVVNETGLKFGKIAQPMRVALTGGTVSPGIIEVAEILGRNKVITRLNRAISSI